MNIPVSSPSAGHRPMYTCWIALLLIGVAELVLTTDQAWIGLLLHIGILVGTLVYASIAPREQDRRLALALLLLPLLRLLPLVLPLQRLPRLAWYPLVAVPLLMTIWMIVRQKRISRQELGLRLGVAPLQLALAIGGLAIGALEYFILRPTPLLATFSWATLVLTALSLIIFTGFSEELLFRALLQRLALPIMGRWSLLYVSLLFGFMHIGYLSIADVLFVALIGLLFAQIGQWSGSILGITLAHGMSNVMLFLIMPSLAEQDNSPPAMTIAAFVLVGGLAFVIVSGIMRLQYRESIHELNR